MEIWDVYFASLCGWLLHPGYLREGVQRPTMESLARMADEMLKHHDRRFMEVN